MHETTVISYEYSYDAGGNLVSRNYYTFDDFGPVLEETDTYTYASSGWKDLLVAYNGEPITYDAIGNPLSYYGGRSFTWEGRELQTFTSGTSTASYVYNENGIRTQKTVNGVTTSFLVDGSTIRFSLSNNLRLWFLYYGDELVGFKSGNDTYYYLKNLQGDIVQIVDESGALVVEYEYDDWGKVLSVTGTLAGTVGVQNPFRYRGYYYDEESGLYYLNSRYYDPETGRFISADEIAYLGPDGLSLSFNLFVYCGNNPVMGYDPEGTLDWGTFFSGGQLALIGLMACATAMTVVSGGACAGLMVLACVTFFAGEVTAFNGASEVIESVTDYNPMRDTVYAGDEQKYETQKTVYAEAAEVGTAALTLASSFDVCFRKGTMISAEEGVLPIESICEGMQVWATDPETGETALKRVLRLFRSETSEWIHLAVDGEEIVCTPGHPFYSPVRGWVAACKLRAGDILVTLNGDFVVLEKVQHELLENPEITYNFEVEGFHTYYVGKNAVLVHNTCGGKPTSPNQMQKQVERGQAPSTVVRVDNPKIPGQLPHIHFSDGTAMNIDGSVRDAMRGVHILTNSERIWIFYNGWGG